MEREKKTWLGERGPESESWLGLCQSLNLEVSVRFQHMTGAPCMFVQMHL